ncbi:MAG: SpoIIE family protein phosphatase [Leptospirales bacterium]|nr:SpoIIE family protein phosphatase [Leptospirales bacterium]
MRLKHILTCVLMCTWIFAPGLLFAQTPLTIQKVTARSVESIASDATHSWWATVRGIEPVTESERLLADGNARQDEPGEPWVRVMLPGYAEELRQHGYGLDGTELWYLKRFYLDKPAGHLAFRLGQIDDKDRVYLNGRLIAKTGDWDNPRAQAYDKVRVYEIPDDALKPGLNVLLIRIKGIFPGQVGMVRGQAEIGPSLAVRNRVIYKDTIEVLLLACYATAGSYFLFLFIRRRIERENLIFAIFIYVFVAYQVLKTQFKFELGVEFITLKKWEYVILYATFPAFYYFIRTYFEVPKTRGWKIWDFVILIPSFVFLGLVAHTFLTDDPRTYWFLQKNIAQPLWIVYSVGNLAVLFSALRRKNRDAIYMLCGFAVLILGICVDITSNRGIINIPPVMSFIFPLFMLSLALVLANRFVRLNEEVADLNANLEQKVEDRTRQLNQSLTEIQALKEKQDGDYFLTSLLIEPLGGNHNEGNAVRTEMVQRQLKQFSFRKWKAEIGGDHCAAHSLKLKDRNYTVFINGDAMGKSIQGAGGALVLGTVFQSLITRTQRTQEASGKYPEQWLKECFLELQNVFVAFNGSMFLSAVVGLVDEQSGLVYFINSEHPRPVLYRKGQASFIESPVLRKIGVPDADSFIQVQTIQLQRDDVIIVGSDGRDDISIGMDEKGNRIINEDEDLFLRHVEAGQGNLDQITEHVFASGGQADDYSLIRISFFEDAAPAPDDTSKNYAGEISKIANLLRAGTFNEAATLCSEIVKQPDVAPQTLLQVAKAFRHMKDYQKSANALEKYLEKNPGDVEALSTLGAVYKLSGNRLAAVEAGERAFLRDPTNVKNLVHLCDAHRLLGNKARAIAILQIAESLGSDAPELPRLRAALF